MDDQKSIISLEKCRTMLGKKFKMCSDEEIIEIRDSLNELASICLRIM